MGALDQGVFHKSLVQGLKKAGRSDKEKCGPDAI
jgi:hypothetical protein